MKTMQKGGKNLLLIWVLINSLLVSSCFLNKKTSYPTPPPADNTKPFPDGMTETFDSIETGTIKIENNPTNPIGENNTPIEEIKRTQYDIALLLPFDVKTNSLNTNNDTINLKSLLAIDFYEGALLALAELQKEGLDLNVYVYDTEKNPKRVQEILRQPHLQNVDLMIGPVYNQPLKLASNFSKRFKILQASPFSPTTSFINENPFYLQMQPTMDVHCAFIYKYLNSVPDYNNVILLHQPRNNEQKMADKFKRLERESIFDGSIETGDLGPMTLREMIFVGGDEGSRGQRTENDLFLEYLLPDRPNVFVVTSFSESFANDMLRRLYAYSEKYEIIVIGMPNWDRFTNINVDYLMDLSVQYSRNYFYNKTDEKAAGVARNYRMKTNAPMPENASRGYDMVYYLGQLMQEQEDDQVFPYISNDDFEGTFSGFNFQPYYDDSTRTLHYFENQHLYMLKYEDYGLIRVY